MFFVKKGKRNEIKKIVPLFPRGCKKSSVTIKKYSGFDDFGNLHKITDTVIPKSQLKKKE